MCPAFAVHAEPVSVQGVVTTGIYCRPDCRAHPKPENVRPFATAAAAEAAGFRACLRCRPYRIDHDFGAIGPDLVCRAVRRVVEGALDRGTENDLGRELGVSARHLRRVFVEHVGTTPDHLARSRRAHFARRLLDDTDLPLTQVARAAGFGSVRQFHRACADTFGFPPSELRARRRKADRLVADGGLALRLPGPPVTGALEFLAARATPGVEVVAGGSYRRTIEIDGEPGVLELWPAEEHAVLVAHLPYWDGLIHVVERARRIVGIGMDVPGAWDPFELAVRAIVGQQITVAGATTITGRIVARHGRSVPGLALLRLTHLFPGADVLATADLDGVGLTAPRCDAIAALAGAVSNGSIVLDARVALDELRTTLTAVKGIGPMTADYVAARLGIPGAGSPYEVRPS